MNKTKKHTAIVLGATGLTGGLLVDLLLNDDRFEKIKMYSRRTLRINNPKIEEYIGDVLNLEQFEDSFNADVVFCCIGTTAKKTPDKELYRAIDYGIPTKAAALCVKNNIDDMLVISALGADQNSRIFYSRTKGEMEEKVKSFNIPHTYLLQPSLIVGHRSESRFGESFGKLVLDLVSPLLLGGLKNYRPIKANTIAQAMVNLYFKKTNHIKIKSQEIESMAFG